MLDRGIAGSEHDCDVDEGTSRKFQNEHLGCCRAGVQLQRTRGMLPRSKVQVTRFLSRQVPRTGHAGVRRCTSALNQAQIDEIDPSDGPSCSGGRYQPTGHMSGAYTPGGDVKNNRKFKKS